MEGRVLQMHVSPAGLLQIAATLAKQDHFDVHRFEPALQHFKTRYFANGAATHHFHGLHVHKFQKKEQDLIEAVLSGKAAAPEEIVAAILLVVYRLRNNLFHGVKWAYGIKDQLDNFAHANEALMQVLCLHEPM